MSPLHLDTLNVPEAVLGKLRELGNGVQFEKQSRKGANGHLFFGTNFVHEQKVAVKFYYWAGEHAYHAEPRTLATLNSENVTRVLDAAIVDEEWAYFVTPFYPRGDIDDELNKGIPGNLRAVNLTRDILNGLSYLHAAQLLHRDLKPQNIFVDDSGCAVIGDLGSVKRVPEGRSTVPGSGHSVIYRPPESVQAGEYGKLGDLYQVGIVFYQLLGGKLPYDETAWLNPLMLKRYHAILDSTDRQIFAANVIKKRVGRGKIVDISTLPSWVCDKLKRTISKACNVDPRKRYQSCSAFLGRIAQIRASIHDWRVEGGLLTRYNSVDYRILSDEQSGTFKVQKRRLGNWRKDNTIAAASLDSIVREIDERCS